MTPEFARRFWKSLLDNASRLITDANVLLDAGSHGRARALTVLAQEELGKALWVYQEFEGAWSEGTDSPRAVGRLDSHGRSHVAKYLEAIEFGSELEAFWGDYPEIEEPADGESWDDVFARRRARANEAAKAANQEKQFGFYVDLDSTGGIVTPQDLLTADRVAEDLERAARVVEMLLIRDHTRMKHDAVTEYDSTGEMQWRLMPISHPADFADFVQTLQGRNHSDEDEQSPQTD